jgi:shikimate kinase
MLAREPDGVRHRSSSDRSSGHRSPAGQSRHPEPPTCAVSTSWPDDAAFPDDADRTARADRSGTTRWTAANHPVTTRRCRCDRASFRGSLRVIRRLVESAISASYDPDIPSRLVVGRFIRFAFPPIQRQHLMIVTLIGYRGTGKTSVARPLAERLGWQAVDADVELESRAGRTIREIFDTDGEGEFRRLERETLVDLLGRDRLVIAAGGGAILNPDTRSDFQSAGPVVWLTASADAIEQRLDKDSTTSDRRPNLTSTGGRGEIEKLLSQRDPLYRECASLEVATDVPLKGETSAPSPEELAEFILTELQRTVPGLTDRGEPS